MNDMTRADDVDPPYLWEAYRSTHLRAPKEKLLELPSDFYDRPGPFVPAGFIRDRDNDLTVHGKGAPVRLVLLGRHDRPLDLIGELVGVAHRPPRAVGESFEPMLLVTVENLVAGLS